MKRWSQFAAEKPEMAEAGRSLVYQFRVGLGYLATVRKDGGPRVHPVCPVIANGGLYLFIGNRSPKPRDPLPDGRFVLHSSPNHEADDEYTVTGRRARAAGERSGGPDDRLRRVHGHGRVHERRHALRALARARAAREVRPSAELASRVHEVVGGLSGGSAARRLTVGAAVRVHVRVG